MELSSLKNRVGKWLQGGPEDDIVVSSRVRLARNIRGYPFVARASEEQIEGIEELLRETVLNSGIDRELSYHRLDQMPNLDVEFLMERHLISRDHADADWIRGVAFSPDEDLSIMINEEDHLRMQVMGGGLKLHEVWEHIDSLDDHLATEVPFAFSPKYGYLTACPTNVGTGMRASAMLHLPALVLRQEMDRVLQVIQDNGLALRGLFGEGTEGSADLYQLSNQVSLGVSEQNIIDKVSRVAREVSDMERSTRERLMDKHRDELRERIDRACDLLLEACRLSSEETLHFLSHVRLGVELGLISEVTLSNLNGLILLTLPAHLQTIEGREVDSLERNELRASYVRERLGSIAV